MTKYTKGKWEMKQNISSPHYNSIVIYSEENVKGCIAILPYYAQDCYEALANANLISKAPEMYELLKDIRGYIIEVAGFSAGYLYKKAEMYIDKIDTALGRHEIEGE